MSHDEFCEQIEAECWALKELNKSKANEARLREALFVTFAWIRQCIPIKYLGEAWADVENRVKRVLEETKP